MSFVKRIVAVTLTLISPLEAVSAFSVVRIHYSGSFRQRQVPTRSKLATTTRATPSDDETEWSPFLQLWLDLRGTAITPRMALSKLEEDVPFPVSKVLVSIQGAQRALQFWEPGDPEMLVVDESDDTLCDAKDLSLQYGTTLTIDGDSFVDPIPALETMSNGGWVLVDSEGGDDKFEERQEAISNLVNFVSGGLSLGSDSFSLGADVYSPSDDASSYNNEKKGIAVACQTKADLLQTTNTLQTIDTGALTTTESGILLKIDPAEESSSSTGTGSFQSALVLPFDISLWKATVLILSEAS